MFLIRIQLDRFDQGVRQCLVNCQDMHRSLMKLFDCSRQEAGVLYRVVPQIMKVYLQSRQRPNPEEIPSGMKITGILDTAPLKFPSGACCFFDLMASPCKKVEPENGGNSQRRFLYLPEERVDWLIRKGVQGGFEIQQIQENVQPSLYGKHKNEKGGKMRWSVANFKGKLKIINEKKFYSAWEEGIGPGRAYGLGMLLLQRIRTK